MSQPLKVFNELKGAIADLVEPCSQVIVRDHASSALAINAAKEIKELISAVEAKRKELVGPLNDEVKRINAYVKDILDPLQRAEAHVKMELCTFAAEQDKIRREKERLLLEERLAKEAEIKARQAAEMAARPTSNAEEDLFGNDPTPILVEQALVVTEYEQGKWDAKQDAIANTRKTWRCEMVDVEKVPKEFLIRTLNESAVKAAARAGRTEIPGVRVWREVSVAIGRNTYVPRVRNKNREVEHG